MQSRNIFPVPRTRDGEQAESQFMARRLRGRKIKQLQCDSSSYLVVFLPKQHQTVIFIPTLSALIFATFATNQGIYIPRSPLEFIKSTPLDARSEGARMLYVEENGIAAIPGFLCPTDTGAGIPFEPRFGSLAVVEKAFAVLDPFFPTTAHFARIFSTIVLSDFEIRTSDLRLRRARAGM